MGRSGLSSRKKHSKKKCLKISSEARRKKSSSRNRSKKRRRHDDSFSSCSDDESTSSSLASSSSSDGEHKSKRARSRSRNEVKSSRKRSRRRSPSEESSKDSRVKKRKRSKKKAEKKNKKIKKKSKRDGYISSASFSTCRDGDSGSDEGESLGRPRRRSIEKMKDHKDPIQGRRSRKNMNRSTLSSPPSFSDDNVSIEKVMVENNSGRLKSVITIAKQPEDEEESDVKKDELKEEIVYDYDDYPSCKSNDSNDGESKKELVDHSNVSPEKRMALTSMIGEVNSTSKEKESNASGSEVDNLESILRQKALENLSRFRGGIQTKTVVSVDNKHKNDESGVKQSMSASVNPVKTSSIPPAPLQDSYSMMAVSPGVQRSRFTWRRDPSVTTMKEEKPATSSRIEFGGSQAPVPKLQTANLSSTVRLENKIVNETPKTMVKTNDDGQMLTNVVEPPASASTMKEGSSKEQKTETNDNSQFEKKTMTVMRGGEMVQVSYKVYIPTRAPALARRQLKR